MKIKAVIFTLCAILSQSVLAKLPPRPAQCPDANIIKQTPLTMAEDILGPTSFATYQFSKYNTETQWGFLIAPIDAPNKAEALKKGNEIMASLQGLPKPVPTDENDGWQCNYHVNGQYVSVAISMNDGMLDKKKALRLVK